jgi:hypothetical protein
MFKNKIDNTANNVYFVSNCNKVYRSKLVKEHLLTDLRCYEDICYTRMMYSFIDRFGFNLNSYYVWDQRDRNIKSTLTSEALGGTNAVPRDYNKMFLDGIMYSINNCNKEKLDSVVYDSLRDIYDYIKNFGKEERTIKIFELYADAVIELNKSINILNNDYMRRDKELNNFYTKLLKRKK